MQMLSTLFMSLLLLGNFSCNSAPQADETTRSIVIEDTAVAKNTSVTAPIPGAETKPVPNKSTPPPFSKISTPETTSPTKAVLKESTITPDSPVLAPPTVASSPREPILPRLEEKETIPEEEKEEVPVESIEQNQAPDHSAWTQLLQQHVDSKGAVNYAGFKRDETKLETYLDELAKNPIASGWSRNEKLAYWINVYNAFTVKLIVDNYPVKSITNLKGGKPWDVKWIQLGGKTYSLNQIENEIIRPQFKEPRIHFAVNCAAESCPPLLNKAWTADQLENYFEQQTKAFINNPDYNQISPNRAQVSKIFDWYGEDFGNLIDFLNRYSDTKIKANAKVSFLEYDWSLNKQ